MSDWKELEKVTPENFDKVDWWAVNETNGSFFELSELEIFGFISEDQDLVYWLVENGYAREAHENGNEQVLEIKLDVERLVKRALIDLIGRDMSKKISWETLRGGGVHE